jgi:hypothetical protein
MRRLLAFYDAVMDAAEGAVLGVVAFVLIFWFWPFDDSHWREPAAQLLWGGGFAALGAAIKVLRNLRARPTD